MTMRDKLDQMGHIGSKINSIDNKIENLLRSKEKLQVRYEKFKADVRKMQ